MTKPEIDFTNERYTAWIESLSVRYRESQIKAAVAVNTEMLKFYFGLGRDLVLMGKDQPWGSGFLKRVSSDLKAKMPKADCFSSTNLAYMRRFFELYVNTIYPQLGGTIEETLPQGGEWALESSQQPIGVSEYRISEILPQEVASDLPSIAEIESAVSMNIPSTTNRDGKSSPGGK